MVAHFFLDLFSDLLPLTLVVSSDYVIIVVCVNSIV